MTTNQWRKLAALFVSTRPGIAIPTTLEGAIVNALSSACDALDVKTTREAILRDALVRITQTYDSMRSYAPLWLSKAREAVAVTDETAGQLLKRLEAAESVCTAAAAVATEDGVRNELLAHVMGVELINRLDVYRRACEAKP